MPEEVVLSTDTEAANGDYKLELTNWQISFCCNDNLPLLVNSHIYHPL
jgi:hypothetical protein